MKALGWLIALSMLAVLAIAAVCAVCLWGVTTPPVEIVADGVRVSLPALNLGAVAAIGVVVGALGLLLGTGVPLLLIVLVIGLLVRPAHATPKPADNPRP
jgi:hypothetical protein